MGRKKKFKTDHKTSKKCPRYRKPGSPILLLTVHLLMAPREMRETVVQDKYLVT